MVTKDQLYDNLVARYKSKLENELGVKLESENTITTKDYDQFREEMMPLRHSFYERLCKLAGKVFKPDMKPEKRDALVETLGVAHITATPEEAVALGLVLPLFFILIGAGVGIALNTMFFAGVIVLFGLVMIPILNKFPYFLANSWRLQASNQMVQCIFFVVTYMRHTSNLELAIRFAADHLSPPLSLDLKKVVYDVEMGQYDTIQESLEAYLETWKKFNPEFIESLHLIEGSLMEGNEQRRVELLDKSLDVMLTETYEKMLHYAHNLKSPIQTLHMLGVILPILGLVILPLVVSFMEGVRWYHVAVLYDIILPVAVYYLAKTILSTRPTGYGDTDIGATHPELLKQGATLLKIGKFELKASPLAFALVIGGILMLIGLSPVIFHAFAPTQEFCVEFGGDRIFFPAQVSETEGFKLGDCGKNGFALLEYRKSSAKSPDLAGKIIGPYGLGASVVSLFFPLALGLIVSLYFSLRTRNLLEVREKSKRLEQEFATALFQLGNRLADGLPAEAAVGRVAEVMQDTVSGTFFEVVSTNIRKLGLGLQAAIFHPKYGAVALFPSAVIESSMRVLVESIRKGPSIAAHSLQNISRYIKEIHQVNERLRDMMADIVGDITSQINFMAPAIAGIVIGITSMITTILGKLSGQIGKLGSEGVGAGGASISSIATLFGDGIPTYFFQLSVGIYVVEILVILTIMANGIQNGADTLGEQDAIGRNVKRSTILYCAIALIVMLIFNTIANQIVQSK